MVASQLTPNSCRRLPIALSPLHAGPASELSPDYQYVDIQEMVTGNREGFVLFKITGYSAVPYIQPGYMVFVDTWKEAKNGDLIVAEVDNMVCVKIFQQSNKGLYLVSANPEYKPRQITPDNTFRVLGVVVGHLAIY